MSKLAARFTLTCVAIFTICTFVSAAEVGHWPLDEGSGDTTANLVAGGAEGVISNGETGGPDGGSVWVNDDERGWVLGFEGSAAGAYVQAGFIPQMTLEQNFTWAFWANHPSANTQTNNVVFGNRKDANAVDFGPREFIKFTPTKFEWHANANGQDNMDYPDFVETPNEWVHHAVVKDGADLVYYRNGEATGDTHTITQPLNNPQPLFFGGDNEGSDGENYQGLLDDLRTFDHALSAGEVQALVPEPSSLSLLLLGLLPFARRRH